MNSSGSGCPHCGKPIAGYGVCEMLYRKRLRAGWRRQRILLDPGPTIDRIANLRAHRWSFDRIGKAAGLPHSAIASIYAGRYKKISEKNFNAIMSVPPLADPIVTVVGFRRRVQALAWMGWSRELVAREMGVSEYCIDTAMDQQRFSATTGLLLVKAYSKLSNIKGPSRRASVLAKNRGFAPPIAWDDDTIDTAPDLRAGIVRGRKFVTRGPRRTHCRKGHEQTPENSMVTNNGRHKCRLCHNENLRNYRKRVKERQLA